MKVVDLTLGMMRAGVHPKHMASYHSAALCCFSRVVPNLSESRPEALASFEFGVQKHCTVRSTRGNKSKSGNAETQQKFRLPCPYSIH